VHGGLEAAAEAVGGETRGERRGPPPDVGVVAAIPAAGEVREAGEPEDDAVAAGLVRAGYSPAQGAGASVVFRPPSRAWLDAAAALVRRVQTGASRRWHAAPRGPRFDFRRTLRTGLRTGGEAVVPRWRAHPRRRARFVLLIDGSRSMGELASPALDAAIALSALSPPTETFTFSTGLRRVTTDVRRAAAGTTRTVHVEHAWGGGTAIGAALDEFLLRFGERLLGIGTVVVIASDGLDVGTPDLLRDAMARLARRSAAIVWINPLLDTPGYEPSAAGMSVARPYITLLASMRDPSGLRALARRLWVR
jgi:uncharacterized protein with von Willebrand factor type A (vWA) domain